MNRRFFLALAVMLPFVPFRSAQAAPDEQPVKVALIDPPRQDGPALGGPVTSFRTYASAFGLLFPTVDENKFFDFKTKTVRDLEGEGIVAGGNGEWRFVGGAAPYLAVRQGAGVERPYAFPVEDFEELNAIPQDWYQDSASVAANDERVEMAWGAHYYRWNTKTRELERNVNCDMESGLENKAISRDGEGIINAGLDEISVLSTETGEFTRHDKVPHATADGARISAFGAYCVYEPETNSQEQIWSVLDTATARDLWTFTLDSWPEDAVLFSPDEKTLVIGRSERKIWEFHDVKTGEIGKTLPMVAGTNYAAFAPDGEMLYSVADGVLYQQSAR